MQQPSVWRKTHLDDLVIRQNLVNFVPLFAAIKLVTLPVRICSLMWMVTLVLSKELKDG